MKIFSLGMSCTSLIVLLVIKVTEGITFAVSHLLEFVFFGLEIENL